VDTCLHALVIGGGIGGLAVAIGLRRAGIDVCVFERAEAIEAVGAGLSLWRNALRALDLLGLGPALAAISAPLAAGGIYGWDGRELVRAPATDPRLLPAGVHRADLQAALLDALGPEHVQLGAGCVGFDQNADGASAHFADGRTVRGDLLIGADGIHSAVRAQLHGRQAPRYAGYTAWRGVVPFDHARIRAGETWGAGARFGCIPLVGGRAYWFATANVPAGERSPEGEQRALLRRFGTWHEPIPALIAAANPGAILRTDIVDRPPLSRWGEGRVTLLGDAAHPMTPNLGQGACQALEDAVVLARCLAKGGDVPAALRAYEAQRIRRTSTIVRQSWRIGWVGQWQHPLAVRARELILGMLPPRAQARQVARVVAPPF
jgi:2-polyprenyl-6-methoxyphenol hydroxylase-like FAD-dependent oxidoreductase